MAKLRMRAFLLTTLLLAVRLSFAATDTLRVMSYNVLYYGEIPACQNPHDSLHYFLKTIVAYTEPDVLGLVKVATFPIGSHSGSGPAGWPDSILRYALNAAFPGRYAACPVTNAAAGNDVQVLCYNANKLGYVGLIASYANINDFNTYRFFYRSPLLATGADTVYLDVTLNHTESGANSADVATRYTQLNAEMNQLQGLMPALGNHINMGDFNFHTSTETGYQRLVNPTDAGFTFFDPPFGADSRYSYPANWDSYPERYAACLTTSTREGNLPNSCGTSGGGKSWYDHIFISRPILQNTLGMRYIANSYQSVGNDGLRTSKSINDTPTNTSAPASVIDALFRMSNKYPVMLSLEVNKAFNAIPQTAVANEGFRIVNPANGHLVCTVPVNGNASGITFRCYTLAGELVSVLQPEINGTKASCIWDAPQGMYLVVVATAEGNTYRQLVVKQ